MTWKSRRRVGSTSRGIRRILLAHTLVFLLGQFGPAPLAGDDSVTARDPWSGPRQLVSEPAAWFTVEGRSGLVGSAGGFAVLDARDGWTMSRRVQLERPVTHGVLAGRDLYLVQRFEETERVVRLNLDEPDAHPTVLDLDPPPRGELRLARMDDYLLVSEAGDGLRILRLPHPMRGDHAHHDRVEPEPVANLPLPDRVRALATSLRAVYLATDNGLTVVDARTPEHPVVHRTLPWNGPEIHSLAANGPTLYAMTEGGLRLVDLEAGVKRRAQEHPRIRGKGIQLAGRTLYVASGKDGLVAFDDVSPALATIFIQVGDFFFNPAGIVNVQQGDTVTWQKPSTSFPHNVFSCNAGQGGCGGATSTEVFSSGTVTTSPFNFSHTFTVPGNNPYVCQAHALSMQGDIAVAAAATPPPGVADGRSGTTPMTVGKITADGTDLRIFFDPAACPGDADDHNILFGHAVDLPATLGGIYGLGGARCSIGGASPFSWTLSPGVPLANDFLWWLIVADDGSGTEGSWSVDSAGGERDGPGINGSSNRCFNSDKDLSNGCPP